MIPKPFNAIGPRDIQELIDNQVRESKTLDYKEQFAGPKVPKEVLDKERLSFMKDVSALANTEGGYLIFGVAMQKDDQGRETDVPDRVVGLQNYNHDNTVNRLQAIIQAGLRPRVPSVHYKQIDCPEGPVLVVRVERSFARPHMVVGNEDKRFWGRGPGRNDVLDTDELRRLFLGTSELLERVRRFREDRLGAIAAGDTPEKLFDGYLLILHVIPLGSFEPGTIVDVQKVGRNPVGLFPIATQHLSGGRYNLDGYVSAAGRATTGQVHSYVQLFRTGVIEAVAVWPHPEPSVKVRVLDVSAMGLELLSSLPKYLALLESLGSSPPYVVLTSVFGVKGTAITTAWQRSPTTIDRSLLRLPEVLLNESPSSITDAMKHTLDALWQAGGLPEWGDYDVAKKQFG